MFPHKKLDWLIDRLQNQVAESGTDFELRHELARACLSKGLYHGGGEEWTHQALTHARKVLSQEPGFVPGLVTAGMALVGMGRPDGARKYLDQALRLEPERADLYLGLGALARSEGDRDRALKALQQACTLAPQDWETNLYLGRALADRARRLGGQKRLQERAQYHLVQAMQSNPSPHVMPALVRDIGIGCLQSGRFREAERLFLRLREHTDHAATARFHLGLVAYELGKYKNAIQYFRQYLQDRPESSRVHAQMAMAQLQLGEPDRAIEACDRALLIDPADLLARYTKGCAFLELDRPADAVRIFKETLRDHPDHISSYVELARTRRAARDIGWLVQALHTECRRFDSLPFQSGPRTPRTVTRERIAVLLEELRAVGPSSIPTMLQGMSLVQDEGVRFQVWEAACSQAANSVADVVATQLRDPGNRFHPELGRQAVATAHAIPEPVLTRGLGVEEDDLKRAAVDRYSAATNVDEHRRRVERERNRARAYQSLVLLAIAARRSRSGRRLLSRWANAADPELAVAAQTGLAMYGDPKAIAQLVNRADQRGASGRIRALLSHVIPREDPLAPKSVAPSDDEVHCSMCGRTSLEASHLMAGSDAVVCDHCVVKISRNRDELLAPDEATCSFCGRTHLASAGVWAVGLVKICSHCLDRSLGLMEREEVNRFLSTC
jgi:tetratricopeptide (TPR) repeat protein